jgi:hypothetical protein
VWGRKVLVNSEWETLFLLSQARENPRVISDHNPLIVDIGEKPMIKSAEIQI